MQRAQAPPTLSPGGAPPTLLSPVSIGEVEGCFMCFQAIEAFRFVIAIVLHVH